MKRPLTEMSDEELEELYQRHRQGLEAVLREQARREALRECKIDHESASP